MKLDDLLSAPDPSAAPPLDRVRAAVFAELEVVPARSWRGDVLWVIGACWLLVLAVGAVMLAGGALDPSHLAERAIPIGALLSIGGACAYTALAPRRRGQLMIGFAIGLVGLVGVVLARQTHGIGTAPQWVCSASHLAVGIAPLTLALALLRKSAIDPLRAGLLGLAVGTTGAVVGELACEQSWAHVAVFHLGAWILLGVISGIVSRRLVPRSFAP